jgi:hypothetical protein
VRDVAVLLKVRDTFRQGCLLHAGTDLHLAGPKVAKKIPPFSFVCKGWIRHARYEAGHFQKVVDLC